MIANSREEKVVVMGDFNCKVGSIIKDNSNEVSKSGKMLRDLAEESNMIFANSNTKCRGTWTKIEKEKKSVIDYALVREEDEEGISSMVIDKEKVITPYRISKEMVYSDHCAILLEMNWLILNKNERKVRYKIVWNHLKVHKDKKELIKIAKEKGKNEVKRIIKVQESLVDLYIQEEKQKEEGLRIIKLVEEIKAKGGMNSTALWEFKKKVDGKNASKCTAIRGKDGEMIEDVEEIKKEYEKFYSDLFKLENPQSEEETLAKEINMFDRWLSESDRVRSSKEEKITYQEVEAIVKSLKDKYTTDRQGLNNVVIEMMGKEIIESLKLILTEIDESICIPKEWEEMWIHSIHKNGNKMELENKRGIFITSIISKIYKKIRMKKYKDRFKEEMSRF
ncbi:kinesin-like protein KIF15 [Palaemon carinicauda]|uniref:kinesin-like protein KIF15 n=1 Tax=Palaemon carinicauda TaxID=392227 RepID=UPI0035B649D9